MWHIITKEEKEASDRQWREQFDRNAEEYRKKAEAREAHIKATTCPHCGRHDPMPPWLMY